jgi:hypothetical protein
MKCLSYFVAWAGGASRLFRAWGVEWETDTPVGGVESLSDTAALPLPPGRRLRMRLELERASCSRTTTRCLVVHHLHELDGPLFVQGHDFGDKGLEVEDGLAAELEAVLVKGCALEHWRLQAVVHLLEELQREALNSADCSVIVMD